MTETTQSRARTSTLYSCLAHSRRRYALKRLNEAGESLALADLAEDVAAWESDRPRSEIAGETVTDVYVSLYHNHVPKLADADLVRYDRERDTVAPAEHADEVRDGIQLAADG